LGASWFDKFFPLPTAVYAAILLFIIKDALEAWMRRQSNIQKLRIFKKVLAYECERNHWFITAVKADAERVRPQVNGLYGRSRR